LAQSLERLPLTLVVDRVFSSDAVPEASRYLERGAHFGKVVTRV